MPNSLDLTIQVPADEWAFMRRRVTYLESLLVRAVRDVAGAQEWYAAEELAGLRLPGLPLSAGSISRRAARSEWQRVKARGRDGRMRTVYHVASLPPRAFDDLIGRILDIEAAPIEPGRPLPARPAAPAIPAELPANAAPAWVLPLMRLVKGEAGGDLSRAWTELPNRLPAGMAMPTIEEAADVLVRFGLIRGG